MNCCVNVVSASFQQFPVNNCNNKLLRRPSGKSQIHPNFANNSIVNITTEKQITTPRSSLLSFTTFALHRYHIINTTAGNSYNTGQQRQQINATIIIWQGIPLSPVWKFTSYFFHFRGFVSSDRSSYSDGGLSYIRGDGNFFRFSLSPLMQLMLQVSLWVA